MDDVRANVFQLSVNQFVRQKTSFCPLPQVSSTTLIIVNSDLKK